jgi:hypothetical protein
MVVVRLGCILSYRFLLHLQLLQMLFRCIDVRHTALRYLSIPSIYRIIISTSRVGESISQVEQMSAKVEGLQNVNSPQQSKLLDF